MLGPMNAIRIDNVAIGPGHPLAVIAGPCQAESLKLCLEVGHTLKARCAELGLGYIFKASFDKANRSSIHTARGPGLDEGLRLLERVRDELGVPVTTDVHEPHQATAAGNVVDLLQVPAFLCRQTDLLVAAAQTGRAVNVKKGQFLSPGEMSNVVTKLTEAGCGPDAGGILLTERGTFFGYHRLVNDFAGVYDLMQLGWPVCFDVTHSTQNPGGQGTSTGGRPEVAPTLARCAVAAGVQALFIEAHPDPANALSDGATMLPLSRAAELLGELAGLRKALT